ncbi:MAG TPA: metallophosphoesterase [Verrucomicrobiae bacterium]
MDKSRLEIKPGVWLDHRRAAYLEAERILCVADLHLGYAWAHRFSGQLMPLRSDEDLLTRLRDLCTFYKPAHLAILGDIVHQAVPIAEITTELSTTFNGLREICGLKLILGNHDKKLRKLASTIGDHEFLNDFQTENFFLTHGNSPAAVPANKFVLMGHEHPSISLGDGIRSSKFPCFMVSETVLLLPAFSKWAAGSDIRSYEFMSLLAKSVRFTRAIAICAEKLLPVKLT